MFVGARGSIIEDEDFVAFLSHCWRFSELETRMLTEVIARCGYGLCFVPPVVIEVPMTTIRS